MLRKLMINRLLGRTGVEIRTHAVQVGSIKTVYYTAGSGPPVLLLHGAGAVGLMWYPVIGPLANHFTVIIPDIVGYGESAKPMGAYDRPFFTEWLCQFLDAIGIGKADVVGHSQGGAIALQFVIDHPSRVDRLVLVDAGALGNGIPMTIFLTFLAYELFPSPITGLMLYRHTFYRRAAMDLALGLYTIQVTRMEGGRRAFFLGHGKAIARVPERVLREIRHKTLIIWGAEDKFFPVNDALAAQRAMPDVELQVIPEAGHVPYIDQPERFNDILLGFLK